MDQLHGAHAIRLLRSAGMRVAVTGASGFVGGAVCRFLAREGVDVLPFDVVPRGPEHTGGRPVAAFDITAGPLPDAPVVHAVVHAAAFVRDTGRLDDARRVNVTGTANVVASFPGARLVHVSSASVYHPHRPQRQAREDEAPPPESVRWPNAYGRTKSEAERLLARIAPEAVVLRPHAVHGPGDTTLLPRIRRAARRRVLPVPGDGTQLHSVTHVDNLARACLLGCTGEPGTYNVNDGVPVVIAESLAALVATGDRPVRVRPVPAGLLMGVAGAAEVLARLTGGTPLVSRYAVEHLALERTFDITAARERLGYRPGDR
jgi:nucleoside-diphosphate-sugar epimerase